MAQSLSATGLSPERAFELAREVEERLAVRGQDTIDVDGLRGVAAEVLREHEGEDAVRRYRDWTRLDRLDRPLIVMIGGAAGVGKSTVASLLAGRLGITRVIATDVVRQVLRSFFTPEAVPAVHRSAFELGQEGFEEQGELVRTAITAIVERACREGTPMVVEGVHAAPCALGPALAERCVAVEALLVVEDEEAHRGHFSLRGAARPAERYHAAFGRIRSLQAHLVARARAEGVTVVANENADATVAVLMDRVLDAVGEAAA